MELELRSMEVRAIDEDTRTVRGIAVPYDTETNVGGYKERFKRGAFGKTEDVKLFYGHEKPIGLITKGEDTDEGYAIEARISKTPQGDEVYTLLRDGVLNKFSVGFEPVKHSMDGDVVVREEALLREVSIVAFAAYPTASISEVRDDTQTNKEKEAFNMSEEITYAPESEVADLRGRTEDLERRLAIVGESTNETKAPLFRSGAELLKGLAAGSQEARDFATVADADGNSRPAWVNERLRLAVENRQFINLFNKGALPSQGMSVEYARVSGTAGTVGRQVNEGDALPYMEVAFDTATAPVNTYGGYSSLSRQAIERTDLPMLETVLEYQARQYAKATEKAVRDAFVAASAGFNTGDLAADATAGDWVDLIVDSVDLIDEVNGGNTAAEFILVSSDVYKSLAHMVDTTGRPLFSIAGQSVNSVGTANIVTGSLNIAGLPVVKSTALADGSLYVGNSEAVKVYESPGAPFRLQDEDIIHLTKDFSLYGYMAVAIVNPLAVVEVTIGA